MNILVVTPYPPVLHVHGGGVRMFHNIRLLAQKHSVRVISFVENEEDLQLLKPLEPVCESVASIKRVSDLTAHWFSLQPCMVREFGTPAMHEAVDAEMRARKIDVIQCEYLQMAQYKRRGVFSILTAHEAYSANAWEMFQAGGGVEKVKLFSRWMSMLNYETSMCDAFDRVVTMTEEDASYLRSYARHSSIRAIPIGIDIKEFQPAPDRCEEKQLQVVFVGNYRHPPNVGAARFLLDEIAPHFPKIRFVIAGSYLPDTFKQAPNVTFPGYIPDTRRLFQSPNTIFAAPLFSGTGQRVKLLEAFAMEAAVITTTVGAAGFPIVNGREAMIADTPEDFRGAVSRLAESCDLRLRLGKEARQMIANGFTWERIGGQFLQMIEEANQQWMRP